MRAVTTAANRRRTRRLSGALLLSLGTAVFSGVVSLVVDAAAKGTAYHQGPIAILTALGLALSGYGSWLLASARESVAIAIAAMDDDGDPGTYLGAIEGFLSYGAAHFTQQSISQASVRTPADLKILRNGVTAGIQALTRALPDTRRIGLFFQGRLHVAFHLGRWLNVPGEQVDLYAPAHSGKDRFFPAIRLTVTPETSAALMDIDLYLANGSNFDPARHVAPDEVAALLANRSGTMALAVSLNGPVDDAGLLTPVKASALGEGVSVLVVMALPRSTTGGGAVPETRQGFESAVTAIIEVIQQIPAATGLLYLKTPVTIAVALGHYLRAATWTPMRPIGMPITAYERFIEP
jgi:hypothetical protein